MCILLLSSLQSLSNVGFGVLSICLSTYLSIYLKSLIYLSCCK